MPRSKSSVENSGGKPKDRSISKANHDQKAQPTISELFATSKHKLTGQEVEDLIEPSPNKRLKRDQSSSLALDSAETPLRTMQQEEMYSSFPTARAKKPDIIEISDDDSPLKTALPRSKPNGVVRPKNVTNQAGLKKLVVKNLRKTPRADPDQYYKHVWDQLDAALSAIFANEKVPYSMEELYRGVEILCRQDRAPSLYTKLCDKCKQVTARMEQPLMEASRTGNNVDVLRTVVEAWSAWNAQLVSLKALSGRYILKPLRLLCVRYSSTWTVPTSCTHHRCPRLRTWLLPNFVYTYFRIRQSGLVYYKEPVMW